MSESSLFVLVACALIVRVACVSKETCSGSSETSVQRCLQPMLDYANELQNEVSMQLTLNGNDIFHKLCALYDAFMRCTETLDCRSLSVDAIQASYGYMCKDGRALFERYVDCFAQVEAHTDYVSCKRTATQAINQLQLSKDNVSMYFDSLCGIMTKYLSCSHQLIVDMCGPQAWALVQRVTEDSLRVTMPQCNLQPVFA